MSAVMGGTVVAYVDFKLNVDLIVVLRYLRFRVERPRQTDLQLFLSPADYVLELANIYELFLGKQIRLVLGCLLSPNWNTQLDPPSRGSLSHNQESLENA